MSSFFGNQLIIDHMHQFKIKDRVQMNNDCEGFQVIGSHVLQNLYFQQLSESSFTFIKE